MALLTEVVLGNSGTKEKANKWMSCTLGRNVSAINEGS